MSGAVMESAVQPPFRSTGPQGHRGRMRERLLTRGPEALADYEILEMLLFLGIPRGDTKPLAKELINRFGSLQAVLQATPDQLAACGVLSTEAIAALRMPVEAERRLAMAEARLRPILKNWDALLAYFDTALAGAVPGQLRVLLLDNRNRLLADETLDEAAGGLPRQCGRRALALHATAMILVRVMAPGPVAAGLARREADLCTAITGVVSALSVVVHDHMLVGGGHWVSLRQKALL